MNSELSTNVPKNEAAVRGFELRLLPQVTALSIGCRSSQGSYWLPHAATLPIGCCPTRRPRAAAAAGLAAPAAARAGHSAAPAGVQRCSVAVGVCTSARQIASKLPAVSTTCYFSSLFLDGFDSAFFPLTELESKMLSCPLAISASFHSSSLAPLSLPFPLH